MLNLVPIALIVAAALAGVGYATSVSSPTDRADCPGTIICPLTGELVCKDECPKGSDAPGTDTDTSAESAESPSCCESDVVETGAIRPDCPGKVVCPLTGELVCEDRCPLGEEQNKAPAVSRSCCQGAN